MIDWIAVGFSALWIFGLSLNLAALGMADYRRSRIGGRLRDIWAGPGYQIVHNTGLTLICVGLIHSARAVWEQALWAALALAFGFFAFQSWRADRLAKKRV